MDVRSQGLTIGEFGRRTGLSQKALRLYDMSGLLRPAAVDPSTGYRRYAPEQLERARRIGLLRQVDMPLAVIAEVLGGTDTEALIRVDRWWAAQEASMVSRRGSLEYVRSVLTRAGRAREPYAIEIVDVPATKIATITRTVDQAALVSTSFASDDEIRRYLVDTGAQIGDDRWLLYYADVTPDSEAPMEACVPFTGTVDPAGDIVIRVEPAHTLVRCTVTKGECYYPQIMLAYDDIFAYVLDHGLERVGPPREMYFVPWRDIGDDDPFVHVAQPIMDRSS